jgi:hypothetical protein
MRGFVEVLMRVHISAMLRSSIRGKRIILIRLTELDAPLQRPLMWVNLALMIKFAIIYGPI